MDPTNGVQIASPVERAAQTTTGPLSSQELSQRISGAKKARTELRKLLLVEQGSQRNTLREIADSKSNKVLTAIHKHGLKYSEFPTEPMTWRDEQGIPELVPFNLTSPRVKFSSQGFEQSNIPVCVRNLYADVNISLQEKCTAKNKMREECENSIFVKGAILSIVLCFANGTFVACKFANGHGQLALTIFCSIISIILGVLFSMATAESIADKRYGRKVGQMVINAEFRGLIPDQVRKEIARAKKLKIFQQLFILAEVPGMKIEEEDLPVPARVGDPLVIGHDGERYWLVDKFDTSPAEAMALATQVKN